MNYQIQTFKNGLPDHQDAENSYDAHQRAIDTSLATTSDVWVVERPTIESSKIIAHYRNGKSIRLSINAQK